eukprot:m.236504 g.236504  ORF g.236504 m.236504 type:complete len:826 (+) comp12981_c0_seq1:40-2517(+)
MAAANVDLEMYILQGYTFAKLPMPLKQALGNSKREWEKAVVEYSLSHQLRWKKNIVRKILEDEKKYYNELLRYSREHLMLYPYHLADVMVLGLRTTPFAYYYSILSDMLRTDKSYDSLPNFTAADCLRLLGIGRNQYIDLMNQSRSKTGLGLFRKRVNPKQLLPTKPIGATNMEFWWQVHIGYVSEEDIKASSPDEHAFIDKLIDAGPMTCGHCDRAMIEALYVRGLVYLTVPINDEDCIVVPPLEGFVMNRVLGDSFENLLYKIFVSIDEYTTINELAGVLRIDLQLVKDAVSMYCRLGFARKKGFEAVPQGAPWHSSWRMAAASALPSGPSLLELGRAERPAALNALVTDMNTSGGTTSSRSGKRLAFLFDASLTAVLMMGNLSPSLKTHAVTMFEAGKLSDESLDSLLSELAKVDLLTEGDTQHYFDHAFTLLQTLCFLRHNPDLQCAGDNTGKGLSLDLLKCESLNSLDPATCDRVLKKNYVALVSMAPLSRTVRSVISCVPLHFGPAIPEASSVWFKLWLYQKVRAGPPSILYVAGWRVRHIPAELRPFETVMLHTWTQDPQEIATAALLPALNESLCNGPVLVQGHRYRSEVETLLLPFPLSTSVAGLSFIVEPLVPADAPAPDSAEQPDSDAAKPAERSSSLLNLPDSLLDKVKQDNARLAGWQAKCLMAEKLPVVLQLVEALALQNEFGYITLIRQCQPSAAHPAPDVLSGSANNDGWEVLDVTFGVPIFDAALNRAVCQRIRSMQLLSEKNAEAMSRNQRMLALELLDFIAQNQSLPLALDPEAAPQKQGTPYPTYNVCCVNGTIARLDPSEPFLN